MKNLRTRIILGLSVLLLVFSGCSKDDDIDIKVIPLENVTNQDFKGYLLENFDTDKDGAISVPEAEAVTKMSFWGFSGSYALDGIEYFTNLKRLELLEHSGLTSLDLSKNTKLEGLNCSKSKITSLDLSNNTSLKALNCSFNNLSALVLPKTSTLTIVKCTKAFDGSLSSVSVDFTGTPSLDTLDCSSNASITSLDLSKCTALKKLSCIGCNIAELDVSHCTALSMLHCNGNEKISWSNDIRLDVFSLSGSDRTSSVDISNVHVAKLDCSRSSVVSVNASDNLSLKEIMADYSSLVSLMAEGSGLVSASLRCNKLVLSNLKNCTKLENLHYYEESDRYGILDLDISGCIALTMLKISNLYKLNATGCSSLKDLNCYGTITNAVIKGCTSLETLKFNSLARLYALDVSDCAALKELSCYGHLTSLDLSANTLLESLTCYGQFTSLDLSANTLLESLTCYAPITECDISKLSKLKYLNLYTEALSSLDVRNNNSLEDIILFYSPSPYSYGGNDSEFEVNASGSLSLRKIGCGAINVKSINAEGCTNLENFTMEVNKQTFDIESLNFKGCLSLKTFDLENAPLIKSLDLSDCVSLESVLIRSTGVQSVKLNKNTRFLTCISNEQLSFLDVEGLQALEVLRCYNNKLSNLALDRCILLKTLECSGNSLTSLDLSACNQLETLNCGTNKLSGSLNVSNCKALRSLYCIGNSYLTKLIVYRNHTISSLQKDSHTALELSN